MDSVIDTGVLQNKEICCAEEKKCMHVKADSEMMLNSNNVISDYNNIK